MARAQKRLVLIAENLHIFGGRAAQNFVQTRLADLRLERVNALQNRVNIAAINRIRRFDPFARRGTRSRSFGSGRIVAIVATESAVGQSFFVAEII